MSSYRKEQSTSNMKYILVTGGVISGVGKGVIASSFGTLLKSCGLEVTAIKIDPYINIDAGTFSPYEHGEVFVLDDGGEVDLDLGNYERFLDVTLHRDNNITTGKIYQFVIGSERTGDYLGKTVQVVPHVTNAIQDWVERVAKIPVRGSAKPQVCIVELGGTIGDIEGMPFVEAFRQFHQLRIKRQNFCVAHVSLVPSPRSTGEPKTKPTQSSVRELRGLGLSPDFIMCRSEKPIGFETKEKISNFCHVAPDQVICIHDLSSIYHVPLEMQKQNVIEFLNERLQLNIDPSVSRKCLRQWQDLADRTEELGNKEVAVKIAIVGKYTKLEDSYASIVKALQHASLELGYRVEYKFVDAEHLELPHSVEDPKDATKTKTTPTPTEYKDAWQLLNSSNGVLVPGGFGSRGLEGKILACEHCRKNKKPFLGICLGLQAAVIEFARNVLGYKNANTTEIEQKTDQRTNNAGVNNTEKKIEISHPVVIEMPEHHTGQLGGTMRLGKRTTIFSDENSTIKQLYGNPKSVDERHRHRYEVNPLYVSELQKHGLRFVGYDEEKTRMEIMELNDHPYYVATQYHPEYLSRPLKPSPPFVGLILASKDKVELSNYIKNGCRLPQRQLSSDTSSDENTEDLLCDTSKTHLNGNGLRNGSACCSSDTDGDIAGISKATTKIYLNGTSNAATNGENRAEV